MASSPAKTHLPYPLLIALLALTSAEAAHAFLNPVKVYQCNRANARTKEANRHTTEAIAKVRQLNSELKIINEAGGNGMPAVAKLQEAVKEQDIRVAEGIRLANEGVAICRQQFLFQRVSEK